MCGRFTLRTSPQRVAEIFGVEGELPLFRPRYNIAPTQEIAIIRDHHLQLVHWGLIPSWADDPKIGSRMINARAEGLADKPAFRRAFKRGRCLVVADGFYEWRKMGTKKQPYLIHRRDDQPFAFAGLAEHWSRRDQTIDSATIITTDPNPLMAPIHDRMPVILGPEAQGLWLDPEFEGREQLLALLRPYAEDDLEAVPVSTLVNSPAHEDPACITPLV